MSWVVMIITTQSRIEFLEVRIAPASLILPESILVYTAANNVANDITVSSSGSSVVITDNNETISVAGAPGFVLSNGNHTATGPGAGVVGISINLGNGIDVIRIVSVVDQLNVFGTGTLDVTIGNGGVANIRNTVLIEGGGGGGDTVTYDNSTDAFAATVTINGSGVAAGGGFFGALGEVGTTGIETINFRMGTATDTVNVHSTGAGITTNITDAGGADTVNVGDVGNMQGISGVLNVGATGTAVSLVLNNSADTLGRAVTISASSVTGLAPAAINFTDPQIAALTMLAGTGVDAVTITSMQSAAAGFNVIDAGGGNDTFQLSVLGGASPVTLRGGGGDDLLTIGSGSLEVVAGAIIVEGGGQAGDQLVVNDSSSPFADTYTLSATTISRLIFTGVTYSGVAGVLLNAQLGNNIFNVNSTASGVPLTINGNGGNDTFRLGGAVNTLDGILSPITVDGGAANDTILVNDAASIAEHAFIINGTAITRDGVPVVTSMNAVEAITIIAGSGNDTIDGRDSALPLTINAGSGDDLVIGSLFLDTLTGGFGRDTYAASGIAGNVAVTDAGITSPSLGNDTFTGGPFEIVKLTGDSGVNLFDALAYNGLAILDGISGKDLITGSDVTFAPGVVIYTDGDGDAVTLKTTKGRLGAANLEFIAAAMPGSAQLAGVNLLGDSIFKGATLALAARPKAGLGDSFANVGFINADGIDLAAVLINGDVGQVVAGDDTLTTPGIGRLAVQSLGAFGLVTQGGTGSTESTITGKLGVLAVKSSVQSIVSAGDIGAVTIGSNFAGVLESGKNITSVTIRGAVTNGTIIAEGAIGAVKIAGSLAGTIAAGLSNFTPLTQAASVVLKSLTVGGDVRGSVILAGSSHPAGNFNADVSIGAITVIGDWVQTDVSAGVQVVLGAFGNTTDTLGVGRGGAFDNVAGGNPAIVARIASITIKGQVSGSFFNPVDHLSFIAQQIGSFKVGIAKLPLTKNTDPAISLGITGDVSVREVS